MSDATVMHLITRYLDGGAETTTDNALDTLRDADADYEIHLGTGATHDPDRLADARANGIETVVFHALRHYNPLGALLSVFTIAWYLRRHDVDILHTHSTEAGIAGRWAGVLARTPVVVHEIHGDPIADDHHPLLNAFVLAAERISARVTDRLIVKSERIRETFLDRGIGRPEQYELIYHGVDVERFQSQGDSVPAEATADDTLQLLFVGRLATGKGLDDLLDAVERLDGVELRIAGDGPLSERLAAEIERRDLPAELLGYRDDIPELLAAADVLVLPSYREGTPRVVTEALAAGTPVVATNIAGIPEQVADGETGYLIEPGDIDALVARLESLGDPERRRQFGARAGERVAQFSVETASQRYRELYRELLREIER
ncbi:glycosyltransferase family 4 protein [Halorientalis pallida]|uniref:glycosyltransferase family 4 protein n=1 Tax=Halorientalis pallida TaxID=2479928 RepID=UPI003C7034F5